MKMKKVYIAMLIALMLSLVVSTDSRSIPAFARKYSFNCNMCHTAYPKLNDFGQRFRDNGYQMPGQEGREKNVFAAAPPVAMRTSTGMSGYSTDSTTTSGFKVLGLDLLAAGVMHENISFLVIYTPRIDEPSADYSGSHDGANPSQPGALESASVIFSNIVQNAVNVRIGRFEPAYHPFSSKRSYYLSQPYEIYAYTAPGNDFDFDANQLGIEVTGHFNVGFKYGLGVVNGTGGSPDNNKSKDVYARLSHTFGRGDGESAGHKIGLFGYYGRQPLHISESSVSPDGEANGCGNKPFYRVGVDGSLNVGTLNLRAMYLIGIDDKELNSIDVTQDYEYEGGIAELDYAGFMNNRLVASLVYNWINVPCYDEESADVSAYSALVRYYFGDWTAVNVALHAEYTYREAKRDETFAENAYTLLVDFAF
jgi:hypothetical protein